MTLKVFNGFFILKEGKMHHPKQKSRLVKVGFSFTVWAKRQLSNFLMEDCELIINKSNYVKQGFYII